MGYAAEIAERAAEVAGSEAKYGTRKVAYQVDPDRPGYALGYGPGSGKGAVPARIDVKVTSLADRTVAPVKRVKADALIGQKFRDRWDNVWTVTRTEPGHVWARQAMLGGEKRFLRSVVRGCVTEGRTIGKPQGNGRPSGEGGSLGFKASVSHVDRPRWTETDGDPNHADGTILRHGGSWPHTVTVDRAAPVVQCAPRKVSVAVVDGKIEVAVAKKGARVAPVIAGTPEAKRAALKSMTKKQARGTYDPSI